MKGKVVTEEDKDKVRFYAGVLLNALYVKAPHRDNVQQTVLRARTQEALRKGIVCLEEEEKFYTILADIQHMEDQTVREESNEET